jgi:hypothetical protein
VARSCECSNEPLGTIKDVEFPDSLSDCQLLNNDCAPWTCSIRSLNLQVN